MRALFGIILPLIAWLVETGTHICAENFFDPLPTPLHSLLWLCVPASNAWVSWLQTHEHPRRGVGVLCGVAQAVAIVYTLLFLPLLPLSVMAILFLGIGFCSLSPLLALPFCLSGLRSISEMQRPAGRGLGFLLGVALMIVAQLPEASTYWGLQLARQPQRRSEGVAWLRRYGQQDVLLQACYQKARWTSSLLGMAITLGNPPPPEEVQPIFFRVTGTPFNELPPPRQGHGFGDEDDGRGQAGVGERVHSVSLASSVLKAELDDTTSSVAWHWDLTFHNEGWSNEAEARCTLLLPPGSVVSDAHLWVADKKRRALIAARGKARLAYEKVIEQKRDPLLITTCGRDRVLVQCFPVPREGDIHIQLSITAPLLLEQPGLAHLKVPGFTEHNFSMKTPHRLEAPGLADQLTGTALLNQPLSTRLKQPAVSQLYCSDGPAFTVGRWIQPPPKATPLWIVIDGSASMQPYRQTIAQAVRAYRSSQPVAVVVASDEVRTLMPLGPAEPDKLAAVADQWMKFPLEGGQDDIPALQATGEGQVLWLHAGQALPGDVATLAPRAGSILGLACRNAPNRLAEELGCREAVRLGSLKEDLERQLAILGGQRPDFCQLTFSRPKRPQGKRSNLLHLNALWALEQCRSLTHPEALKLAVQYRLVTPDTGAVVLENEEQERQYGLRPPGEIPAVPEPATLVLFSALAAWMLWQRRR